MALEMEAKSAADGPATALDSTGTHPDGTEIPGAAAPKGYVLRASLANWGFWTALMTPALVTLAVRVAQVAGSDYQAVYSMVLTVGATVALFGNPLWGRLSDRTRSRFGRRKPWVAVGVAAGVLGIAVLAFVPTVWAMVLGWALAQAGFNAAIAAMMATIPDQVPAAGRGRASGAFGAAVTGGILTGSAIAAITGNTTLMFMLPAVLAVALSAQFVLWFKDSNPTEAPDRFSLKEFGATFVFNPRKHPDFGWAWLSKFFVMFGSVAPMSYMVYFVAFRLDMTAAAAGALVGGVFVLGYAVQTVLSLAGGWVSDKIGRRKPLVVLSALLVAIGLGLMATATGLPMIIAAQLVLSVGGGLFYAVDTAMVTQVLPNRTEAAKDLGVANIANTLPQSILPLLAPFILAVGGGSNYALLFGIAGAVALVGAVTVLRVKSVR
ncbi:MAG TPA: MFS transporter [Glycomyces sp.]|nr:MFS transporter [Glycomyces sp.]